MPKSDGPPRTENETKHAREADESAKQLVETIKPMHRPEAEKYVSENPPSPAVIVGMAFYRNHLASRKPRPDALGIEIAAILNAKPQASADDVISALRERAKGPLISDVLDDGTVEWVRNGASVETNWTAIAKRISRINNTKKQ